MPNDEIDRMFAELDEYYPGSKKKRRFVEKPVQAKPTELDWDRHPFVKHINGKPTETFTIGALAEALGRPVVTLRLWTRKGYIPQAPYRLPDTVLEDGTRQKGRRLYTRALIEATVAAFATRGLLDKPRVEWSEHSDLSIELFETWTKIHAQEKGQ